MIAQRQPMNAIKTLNFADLCPNKAIWHDSQTGLYYVGDKGIFTGTWSELSYKELHNMAVNETISGRSVTIY